MLAREGRGRGRHHELLIGPEVLLVFVVREYYHFVSHPLRPD
jgi:hypothetical protein